MSINIDKKKLREALDWLEFSKAFPLWFHRDHESCSITYDGEYIKLIGASGRYPAIGTGYSFPYQAKRDTFSMSPRAHVKSDVDTSIYFFFLEPSKGEYDDFQGFRHDGVYHCMEFRSGGAEEQDNIAGQDWTTEHEFKINHKKNQTLCQGYIDGVLKAESTDNSKISAQPFAIYCCEPNGVARTLYLKYPPGIYEQGLW